jgi:hypothetical protein
MGAINGTITVNLNATPTTTLTTSDFTVSQAINSGTATTVTPTSVSVSGTTATLTVPTVTATAASQSVVDSVSLDGATAVAASAYTVAAATGVSAIYAVDANNNQTALTSSTAVPANDTFLVQFQGSIDFSTVSNSTITLSQGGVNQLIDVTYDSSKNQADVSLSSGTLTGGKTYTLSINGVKDTSGNPVAATTQDFTVSSAPVLVTAVTATGTTALSGANITSTDFSKTRTNALALTFNNALDATTVNTSNVKLYDETAQAYVPLSVNVDIHSASVVDVLPYASGEMTAGDQYQLQIGSGLADLNGNKFAGQNISFYYNATPVALSSVVIGSTTQTSTGGTIGNAVTGVYPDITASGANAAFRYVATFNQALDSTTVNSSNVTLTNTSTGATIPATVTYDSNSYAIVLVPNANLSENTEYTVTMNGINSSGGLSFGKTTQNITTGIFTAPTVTASTPANGTNSVSTSAPLSITFSQPMDTTTATPGTDITLTDVTNNNTAVGNFNGWLAAWNQAGTTLTITPPAGTTLNPNHTYNLVIGTGVTNSGGVAIASKDTIAFNTAAAAATTLSGVQTGNYDSTGTAITSGSYNFTPSVTTSGADLFFNFSQALKTNSGSYDLASLITVQSQAAGASGWTTVPVVDSGTTSGDVIVSLMNSGQTLEVAAPYSTGYASDTTYKVTIPNTVLDVNGNAVSAQTFTFTTGPAPQVGTSYPASFATGVSVTNPYIIVPITDANGLNASTLANVKVVNTTDGSSAPYSVAFEDYSATQPSGITVDTTIGSASATLSSATGVQVGDIVTINNQGTFVITALSGTIATLDHTASATATGATTTFDQGIVFQLNNNAQLAGNTVYQVQISGVTNNAGDPVTATNLNFTTGAAPASTYLQVTSVTPSNQTNVAVDTPIVVEFNEPLTSTAIGSGALSSTSTQDTFDPGTTVQLLDTTAGTAVTGTVAIGTDGKSLVITPDANLAASNTVYNLAVKYGVDQTNDTGGTYALQSTYDYQFQTQATAPTVFQAVYDSNSNLSSAVQKNSAGVYTLSSDTLSNPIVVYSNNGSETNVGLNGSNLSVSAINVSNGNSVSVTGSVYGSSVDGGNNNAVEVSLVSPAAGSYQATISGLTDQNGNPVASKSIYFTLP